MIRKKPKKFILIINIFFRITIIVSDFFIIKNKYFIKLKKINLNLIG